MSGDETFEWNGETLTYERGEYNNAGDNERAVEVPIARWWINEHGGGGLEVGNVLSHYCDVSWPVFDRYEGPLKVDVFDLVEFGVFAGQVDWIVSVSTLEHVRWDEEPREPDGTSRAIRLLRSLLAPHGSMLVTMPFGVRDELDAAMLSGELGHSRSWIMRRAYGSRSRWFEGAPVPKRPWVWGPAGANVVWIAEFGATEGTGQ